ncbi:hypothetical protein [Rheinheimera sp. 4Y26]|uniref:hypothetical protein n=1 Tax=Rheinheimera sp. 4Y26 TaxID=2977811 RepID=UPI0021B0DECC|nr:hypothetical protein [Rheinheimera sp. 4Y26]MCT6698053.1 hypothetical protein [Rheinheimera sp. 4Y26]
MNNEFDFAALSKSWQQQPLAAATVPTAADLTKARQRQRQQWLLLAGEWLGATAMAGAAWWLLTSMQDWLSYIAAAFLLLGVLMSLYVSWQVHRPLLAYDNWSSSGVLAFRLRSCQLSLLYYRYNQLACALLLLFVLVLWGLWLWQSALVPVAMLKFYSLIALPLCLYGIYLLQQRIGTKQQEIAPLQALLKDFQSETV